MLHPVSGELRVSPNASFLQPGLTQREYHFFLQVEARDSYRPMAHTARTNLTVYARFAPVGGGGSDGSTTLVVEPVDGLDVYLVEHYRPRDPGDAPLHLGQLTVRNAPVGAVHR